MSTVDFISVFSFSGAFLLALLLGLVLPGYLLLRVLAPNKDLSALEQALYSFALGIGITDASFLLLGKLHIPFTALNIGFWYALLFIIFFIVLRLRRVSLFTTQKITLFTNRKEFTIGILILIFLFFIKGFYLSGTILPTATDLGHHLYWAKLTSDTQALPVYEKQEIVPQADGSHIVTPPTPIADFIIGEHLPLSFLHIVTGASYFGTFPILFLFLLNLGSVLAYALLLFYVAKNIQEDTSWRFVTPSIFFLVALFVFGGLFALASPEMKFVSGGVVGNLFGNFFIPLALILLIRTLREKSAPFLSLFLLLSATLAYTHHLSTFVLLYILVFTDLALIIFWRKELWQAAKSWFFLFTKPAVWGTVLGIALFAFFVALPTYLELNAVGTAVGTPTKDTRTGLTFFQLTSSNSAYKLGLAVFALFIIAGVSAFRKNVATILLFAYGVVLLIMTIAPQLLYVDIPSNRISHYLSFPLTLLALFGSLFLIEKYLRRIPQERSSLQNSFIFGGILLIAISLIAPGLEDNSKTLTSQNQALYVKETFKAAEYLQKHAEADELILRDHNFIQASDTWMKLFFSHGYNYPFSRSFFKRYEDNPEREQCTLAMIATPNTPFGKRCYEDLPVRFLVVNPNFDAAQFQRSEMFSLVYQSANIAIYSVFPSLP